jgi:hypothetical protein
MPKTPYTVMIKIKLSRQQIDDIVLSALKGCLYWADDLEIIVAENKKDPKPTMWPSEALTNGYALKIHDAEEDKWEKLTIRKLLNALSKTPHFNYDNYDQYDAEQVLQKALFGKVVYA